MVNKIIMAIILLILGSAMIILTVFANFAPDGWIWIILGILLVITGVTQLIQIKRHKQNAKDTS